MLLHTLEGDSGEIQPDIFQPSLIRNSMTRFMYPQDHRHTITINFFPSSYEFSINLHDDDDFFSSFLSEMDSKERERKRKIQKSYFLCREVHPRKRREKSLFNERKWKSESRKNNWNKKKIDCLKLLPRSSRRLRVRANQAKNTESKQTMPRH